MSRPGAGLAAAALLALSPAAPGAGGNPTADPASMLHRNPFERPDLVAVAPSAVARAELAPPPWTPELRATLVTAEGVSLANVDGEMIQKGQEYQGYKLVDIREREAVFERGGKRWVLSLD